MRPAPLLALALAALAAAAPPRPALAHHCFPDIFDADGPLFIRGKVIAVEWVNPHALIYVTGPATGPRTQAPMTAVFWAGTPNGLIRSGLTRETLKAGEVIIAGSITAPLFLTSEDREIAYTLDPIGSVSVKIGS